MPDIKCPKCNASITYADTEEGKKVKCPSCGTEVLGLSAANKLLSLKCEQCGGVLTVSPGISQIVCPFCSATYLLPPSHVGVSAPGAGAAEYIAPFKILENKLLEHLKTWLNKGVFTAGDADTATTVIKVAAKYLPLFICAAEASSQWNGQYSTERTRTVSGQGAGGTRTETYKEWHPTSGSHTGRYRVAICASASLPQADLDKLAGDPGNFKNDEGSLPYASAAREDHFDVERPGFDAEEGKRRAKIMVESLERAACGKQVERLTSCATQIGAVDARLSYHPIWWLTYSYKSKQFNCVMDGRTGVATGKKPISKGKIVIAVIVIAILLIVIILAFVCFGGVCSTSQISGLLHAVGTSGLS